MIEVKADNGLQPLALNTSTPSPSQAVAQDVDLTQSNGKQPVSAPALTSASSTAVVVNTPNPANAETTGSSNETASGTGLIKPLPGGCGVKKRSWSIRGRIVAYLHPRTAGDCLAPGVQQPAAGLVPDSSSSESEPTSTTLPQPQPAQETPQPDSEPAKAVSQKESQPTTPAVAPAANNSPEAQPATPAAAPAGNNSPESQPATPAAAAAANNSPELQPATPAKAPAAIDSPAAQAATPAVVPAVTTPPVVVQGQTVPANGDSITINSQPVKVASGSIYVGGSAAPIPQAQATQLQAQPITADSLTFHPASPSQVLNVAPSPVVVGGLTFSASPSEPSVESNATPDQAQAQPVVVGGKTYAPVSPTSGATTPQADANPSVPGESEPATSNQQSDSTANNDNTELGHLNPISEQADSKPVVIGDMTYTPVATGAAGPSPAPTSQNAPVYLFSGIALTQGGSAITVSNTRISLGASGVLVGTSSIPFSAVTPVSSLLQIGSQILTALPGSEKGFEIDHTILSPGSSAISVGGVKYSVNEAGHLIAGTSTVAMATVGSGNSGSSMLTADGMSFVPLGSTGVVVDGSTLSVGGSAITEDGTRLSLASSGIVIGSSTFAYPTPVTNAATVSTASGTSSTTVVPSGGAVPTTLPSATGRVEKGAASAKTGSLRLMTIWVGVSVALSISIGMS